MSKAIHRAPLAIASDGVVLLNVAMFDVQKKLELLYELALRERGAVFIGIAVTRHELDRLRDQVDDTLTPAAFGVVGSRQSRRRRNAKR